MWLCLGMPIVDFSVILGIKLTCLMYRLLKPVMLYFYFFFIYLYLDMEKTLLGLKELNIRWKPRSYLVFNYECMLRQQKYMIL